MYLIEERKEKAYICIHSFWHNRVYGKHRLIIQLGRIELGPNSYREYITCLILNSSKKNKGRVNRKFYKKENTC